MKKFEFELTKEQTKHVEQALETAYQDFDSGKPGAVLGHIKQYERGGPVIFEGAYLPSEYAERIIKIIKEFIKSEDEVKSTENL